MAGYNLTPRQKEIVRWLVSRAEAGATGEFSHLMEMGVPARLLWGDQESEEVTRPDLLALHEEGLIALQQGRHSYHGGLRQRAFDAVASNFDEVSAPRASGPDSPSSGAMERRGKWQPLRELDEGGQGKVFVALDTSLVNADVAASTAQSAIQVLAAGHNPSVYRQRIEELFTALRQFQAMNDQVNLGALKILHRPRDSAGLEKAMGRMANEIRAYGTVIHPNLLRLLDNHLTEGWFVTEYHPLGPLSNHLGRYQGDPVQALVAFRSLVAAVAALHSKGLVHRDIKPGNVFVRPSGDLVLGDTGLVFFTDDRRTRVSDKIENVGSRDWMPGWAMGMRLEDVRPTFDVFALGKLLWAMVSGKPILRLWYYHDPEFDLLSLA